MSNSLLFIGLPIPRCPQRRRSGHAMNTFQYYSASVRKMPEAQNCGEIVVVLRGVRQRIRDGADGAAGGAAQTRQGDANGQDYANAARRCERDRAMQPGQGDGNGGRAMETRMFPAEAGNFPGGYMENQPLCAAKNVVTSWRSELLWHPLFLELGSWGRSGRPATRPTYGERLVGTWTGGERRVSPSGMSPNVHLRHASAAGVSPRHRRMAGVAVI